MPLTSTFALHPALAPLLPLYTSNKLAFVHAIGQPNPTRSHFTDMDEMERAAPGSSLRTGWLDRMVGATTTPGPFAATALGASSAPRSSPRPHTRARGALGGLALAQRRLGRHRDNAVDHGAAGAARGRPRHGRRPGPLDPRRPLDRTRPCGRRATPRRTAPPTPRAALGDALRDTARLVKAGVGLRAVTVDSGNWDMHSDLGRSDSGWMYRQLTEVGKALAAFMTDLGTAADRVILVTLSEFGRRVAENGSGGLDHGYGNVSFVLGGAVNGGTVYGAWPGLGADQLQAGDLKATTDYRVVLGEILEKRCGLTAGHRAPRPALAAARGRRRPRDLTALGCRAVRPGGTAPRTRGCAGSAGGAAARDRSPSSRARACGAAGSSTRRGAR